MAAGWRTHAVTTRTIACEDRDFVEWRGAAEHVLIWAVLIDDDGVRAAVESARSHWSDVLLPRYQRQPHITLGYGGPMPAPGAQPLDPPYSLEQAAADLAAVEALNLAPFEVEISGWDAFQMGPFLHARAPELTLLATTLREDRLRPYIPHVTIGHWAVSTPMSDVGARASQWQWPPITVPVSRLSLLRYDAADIAGPLTEVGGIGLT